VAYAWIRLYGWPYNWRIWVAFALHDIGYFGKTGIDNEDGERHPELGARIMHMFDREGSTYWHDFALFHSRFYAKKHGAQISQLCVADKLAMVVTPTWLHILLSHLSGEIHEYRALLNDKTSKYGYNSDEVFSAGDSDRAWFTKLRLYMIKWVIQNKDLTS
jgi:hypothetical protein